MYLINTKQITKLVAQCDEGIQKEKMVRISPHVMKHLCESYLDLKDRCYNAEQKLDIMKKERRA